jgi:hypothetical protein
MKTSIYAKAIALTALVTALSGPTLASAKPAPDVFERAVAHSEAKMQGYRFITDTLGGSGRPAAAYSPYQHASGSGDARLSVPSYRFITDTLGGSGRPVAAFSPYQHAWGPRDARLAPQSYRFVTDTLGGNGGPQLQPASQGFDWADAGVGAGIALGTLALMAACLILARQLRHRPQTA